MTPADVTPADMTPAGMTGSADLARRVREVTTARVLTGRVGSSYRTSSLLALRADHAAARDAVTAELDLTVPPLAALAERYGVFAVDSRAADGAQHLRRPDLGRLLSEGAARSLRERCPPGADLQVVLGDGLSASAVAAQVPGLLPLLLDGAAERGWSTGQVFAVRHCRVGILNRVGELLDPAAVVLLVGERPGLGTAESLSAYLAWRPRPGHTDADRNLVAGIHARGLSHADAAARVLDLVAAMRAAGASGVALKEVDRDALLPEAPP
ncbi:MAG TPA: ethanolamine ammonia-lyase subunit EutC [Mycobacteriales bacterium]|jgi:ethanolamine ammonia-lyase small subunit|nr:ethanolamine ammonia-lyase subunit EutC [Mycobacteriales bacterium]